MAGLLGAAAFACSTAPAPKKHPAGADVQSADDGNPALPPAPAPDYENVDSGAFTAPGPDRPRDAAAPTPDGSRGNPTPVTDAGTVPVDASIPVDDGGPPPVDSGTDSGTIAPTLCPTPLANGDLAIVEMMIASVSGAGDRGEWVEIQSTRNCTLNLKGLHVESPHGTYFDYVDVTDDMMLAPNATFLVADTIIDSLNHHLPGTVLSWVATDALKNDGDTVTVKLGATLIDQLTYGTWGGSYPGRSLSFSVDCTWAERSSWARWTWSASEWTPGFKGTPNADNSDVKCF